MRKAKNEGRNGGGKRGGSRVCTLTIVHSKDQKVVFSSKKNKDEKPEVLKLTKKLLATTLDVKLVDDCAVFSIDDEEVRRPMWGRTKSFTLNHAPVDLFLAQYPHITSEYKDIKSHSWSALMHNKHSPEDLAKIFPALDDEQIAKWNHPLPDDPNCFEHIISKAWKMLHDDETEKRDLRFPQLPDPISSFIVSEKNIIDILPLCDSLPQVPDFYVALPMAAEDDDTDAEPQPADDSGAESDGTAAFFEDAVIPSETPIQLWMKQQTDIADSIEAGFKRHKVCDVPIRFFSEKFFRHILEKAPVQFMPFVIDYVPALADTCFKRLRRFVTDYKEVYPEVCAPFMDIVCKEDRLKIDSAVAAYRGAIAAKESYDKAYAEAIKHNENCKEGETQVPVPSHAPAPWKPDTEEIQALQQAVKSVTITEEYMLDVGTDFFKTAGLLDVVNSLFDKAIAAVDDITDIVKYASAVSGILQRYKRGMDPNWPTKYVLPRVEHSPVDLMRLYCLNPKSYVVGLPGAMVTTLERRISTEMKNTKTTEEAIDFTAALKTALETTTLDDASPLAVVYTKTQVRPENQQPLFSLMLLIHRITGLTCRSVEDFKGMVEKHISGRGELPIGQLRFFNRCALLLPLDDDTQPDPTPDPADSEVVGFRSDIIAVVTPNQARYNAIREQSAVFELQKKRNQRVMKFLVDILGTFGAKLDDSFAKSFNPLSQTNYVDWANRLADLAPALPHLHTLYVLGHKNAFFFRRIMAHIDRATDGTGKITLENLASVSAKLKEECQLILNTARLGTITMGDLKPVWDMDPETLTSQFTQLYVATQTPGPEFDLTSVDISGNCDETMTRFSQSVTLPDEVASTITRLNQLVETAKNGTAMKLLCDLAIRIQPAMMRVDPKVQDILMMTENLKRRDDPTAPLNDIAGFSTGRLEVESDSRGLIIGETGDARAEQRLKTIANMCEDNVWKVVDWLVDRQNNFLVPALESYGPGDELTKTDSRLKNNFKQFVEIGRDHIDGNNIQLQDVIEDVLVLRDLIGSFRSHITNFQTFTNRLWEAVKDKNRCDRILTSTESMVNSITFLTELTDLKAKVTASGKKKTMSQLAEIRGGLIVLDLDPRSLPAFEDNTQLVSFLVFDSNDASVDRVSQLKSSMAQTMDAGASPADIRDAIGMIRSQTQSARKISFAQLLDIEARAVLMEQDEEGKNSKSKDVKHIKKLIAACRRLAGNAHNLARTGHPAFAVRHVFHFWHASADDIDDISKRLAQVETTWMVQLRRLQAESFDLACAESSTVMRLLRKLNDGDTVYNLEQAICRSTDISAIHKVIPQLGKITIPKPGKPESHVVLKGASNVFLVGDTHMTDPFVFCLDLFRTEVGRLPISAEVFRCKPDTTIDDVARFGQRVGSAKPHAVFVAIRPSVMPRAMQVALIKVMRDLPPKARVAVIEVDKDVKAAFIVGQLTETASVRSLKAADPAKNLAELKRWVRKQSAVRDVTVVTSGSSGTGKTRFIFGLLRKFGSNGPDGKFRGPPTNNISINGPIRPELFSNLEEGAVNLIQVSPTATGDISGILFDFMVLRRLVMANGKVVDRNRSTFVEATLRHKGGLTRAWKLGLMLNCTELVLHKEDRTALHDRYGVSTDLVHYEFDNKVGREAESQRALCVINGSFSAFENHLLIAYRQAMRDGTLRKPPGRTDRYGRFHEFDFMRTTVDRIPDYVKRKLNVVPFPDGVAELNAIVRDCLPSNAQAYSYQRQIRRFMAYFYDMHHRMQDNYVYQAYAVENLITHAAKDIVLDGHDAAVRSELMTIPDPNRHKHMAEMVGMMLSRGTDAEKADDIRFSGLLADLADSVGTRQRPFVMTGYSYNRAVSIAMRLMAGVPTILCGATGSGKCLARGTKVLMASGQFQCAEDIQAGDMIMGAEGTPKRVLTVARGREEMARVETGVGAFTSNMSHVISFMMSGAGPTLTKDSDCRVEFVLVSRDEANEVSAVRARSEAFTDLDAAEAFKATLEQPDAVHENCPVLHDGTILDMPVRRFLDDECMHPNLRERAFMFHAPRIERFDTSAALANSPPAVVDDVPDAPSFEWTLGAWLGTGSVGHDGEPQLTAADPDVVEGFRLWAKSVGCRLVPADEADCYILLGDDGLDSPFLTWLRANDLCSTKHVPPAIKLGSVQQRLSFLAGFVDTNGTLDSGAFVITHAQGQVEEDIKFIARALGLLVKESGADAATSSFMIHGALPCRVHKTDMASPDGPTPVGFTVTPQPEDDYYGFTMEGPTCRFIVTESMLVTHNTYTIQCIAERTGMELIHMRIHAAYDETRLYKELREKVIEARDLYESTNRRVILFFDELNTTKSINIFKEIICEHRIDGVLINEVIGRNFLRDKKLDNSGAILALVGAINPYVSRSDEELTFVRRAGLNLDDLGSTTDEKMAKLVYRVEKLPPTLTHFVVSFESLPAHELTDCIRIRLDETLSRMHSFDKGSIAPDTYKEQLSFLSVVTHAAHSYMTTSPSSQCRHVSFREVNMVAEMFALFTRYPIGDKHGLMEYFTDDAEAEVNKLTVGFGDYAAAVTAVACVYGSKVSPRTELYDAVATAILQAGLVDADSGFNGEEVAETVTVFRRCVTDHLQLPKGTAMNDALSENCFLMVCTLVLRLPMYIIGLPGTSKTLSKTVIKDTMVGTRNEDALFSQLPAVHFQTLQCSPITRTTDLAEAFETVEKSVANSRTAGMIYALCLEEIGLAEMSTDMPLKILHQKFDHMLDVPVEQRIGFVAMSNWALDPAKLNRGLWVLRDTPSEADLIKTAVDITVTNQTLLHGKKRAKQQDVDPNVTRPFLEALSKAYQTLVRTMAEESTTDIKPLTHNDVSSTNTLFPRSNFFAQRDFFSACKLIADRLREPGMQIQDILVEAVRRNFSGLPAGAQTRVNKMIEDAVIEIERINISDASSLKKEHRMSRLIKTALRERGGHARYPMIISSNPAGILKTLVRYKIVPENAEVIWGSSFEKDRTYVAHCALLQRLKVQLDRGGTVVLTGLDKLYEACYDLFNCAYTTYGARSYVDLGFRSIEVKALVHKNFRLIVIATPQEVYRDMPIPLLNRFEKYLFDSSLENMTDVAANAARTVIGWVTDQEQALSRLRPFGTQTAQTPLFVGHGIGLEQSIADLVDGQFDDEASDADAEAERVVDFTKAALWRTASEEARLLLGQNDGHAACLADALKNHVVEAKKKKVKASGGKKAKDSQDDEGSKMKPVRLFVTTFADVDAQEAIVAQAAEGAGVDKEAVRYTPLSTVDTRKDLTKILRTWEKQGGVQVLVADQESLAFSSGALLRTVEHSIEDLWKNKKTGKPIKIKATRTPALVLIAHCHRVETECHREGVDQRARFRPADIVRSFDGKWEHYHIDDTCDRWTVSEADTAAIVRQRLDCDTLNPDEVRADILDALKHTVHDPSSKDRTHADEVARTLAGNKRMRRVVYHLAEQLVLDHDKQPEDAEIFMSFMDDWMKAEAKATGSKQGSLKKHLKAVIMDKVLFAFRFVIASLDTCHNLSSVVKPARHAKAWHELWSRLAEHHVFVAVGKSSTSPMGQTFKVTLTRSPATLLFPFSNAIFAETERWRETMMEHHESIIQRVTLLEAFLKDGASDLAKELSAITVGNDAMHEFAAVYAHDLLRQLQSDDHALVTFIAETACQLVPKKRSVAAVIAAVSVVGQSNFGMLALMKHVVSCATVVNGKTFNANALMNRAAGIAVRLIKADKDSLSAIPTAVLLASTFMAMKSVQTVVGLKPNEHTRILQAACSMVTIIARLTKMCNAVDVNMCCKLALDSSILTDIFEMIPAKPADDSTAESESSESDSDSDDSDIVERRRAKRWQLDSDSDSDSDSDFEATSDDSSEYDSDYSSDSSEYSDPDPDAGYEVPVQTVDQAMTHPDLSPYALKILMGISAVLAQTVAAAALSQPNTESAITMNPTALMAAVAELWYELWAPIAVPESIEYSGFFNSKPDSLWLTAFVDHVIDRVVSRLDFAPHSMTWLNSMVPRALDMILTLSGTVEGIDKGVYMVFNRCMKYNADRAALFMLTPPLACYTMISGAENHDWMPTLFGDGTPHAQEDGALHTVRYAAASTMATIGRAVTAALPVSKHHILPGILVHLKVAVEHNTPMEGVEALLVGVFQQAVAILTSDWPRANQTLAHAVADICHAAQAKVQRAGEGVSMAKATAHVLSSVLEAKGLSQLEVMLTAGQFGFASIPGLQSILKPDWPAAMAPLMIEWEKVSATDPMDMLKQLKQAGFTDDDFNDSRAAGLKVFRHRVATSDQTQGWVQAMATGDRMRGTFLPTDDDATQEVFRVMSDGKRMAQWVCTKCGTPFFIGECSMPMQVGVCVSCGAQVGGTHHNPLSGSVKVANNTDAAAFKDSIEIIRSETIPAGAVRSLSTVGVTTMARILLLSIHGDQISHKKALSLTNLALTHSAGKVQSVDEMWILLHLLFIHMAKVCVTSFNTADSRNKWELEFNKAYHSLIDTLPYHRDRLMAMTSISRVRDIIGTVDAVKQLETMDALLDCPGLNAVEHRAACTLADVTSTTDFIVRNKADAMHECICHLPDILAVVRRCEKDELGSVVRDLRLSRPSVHVAVQKYARAFIAHSQPGKAVFDSDNADDVPTGIFKPDQTPNGLFVRRFLRQLVRSADDFFTDVYRMTHNAKLGGKQVRHFMVGGTDPTLPVESYAIASPSFELFFGPSFRVQDTTDALVEWTLTFCPPQAEFDSLLRIYKIIPPVSDPIDIFKANIPQQPPQPELFSRLSRATDVDLGEARGLLDIAMKVVHSSQHDLNAVIKKLDMPTSPLLSGVSMCHAVGALQLVDSIFLGRRQKLGEARDWMLTAGPFAPFAPVTAADEEPDAVNNVVQALAPFDSQEDLWTAYVMALDSALLFSKQIEEGTDPASKAKSTGLMDFATLCDLRTTYIEDEMEVYTKFAALSDVRISDVPVLLACVAESWC
ncbi:E3 ubiquitin-protein ligase [Carpediemonas membranifera]|uniref:E3 ubiquitin-protein ligase n=1 Tax=Carpediemonas membranifera TaxID=201153 RepID=A0A8J6B186_9EUKA|nr:E3 ubiquitin-protein ligase [Carpediemonas membranifera]|eukprot:KAG9397130.1 E3 ubiquitin-protein ligase [Carpediemonas membranifera]